MRNEPWHYDYKGDLSAEDEDEVVFGSQRDVRRAIRTFERASRKQTRPAAIARVTYERATQPSAREIFAAAHAAKYGR